MRSGRQGLQMDRLLVSDQDGATALSPDDLAHLIPSNIKTRDQLNFAEAMGIALVQERFESNRLEVNDTLDDLFVRELHKLMFKNVWTWAGKYRQINLNIGDEFFLVPGQVRNLMQDVKLWLQADLPAELDLAACKLHHGLVAIHPFVNGNGRHARLFTDILMSALGLAPFDWGMGSSAEPSDIRRRYITALKQGDEGDVSGLYKFLRPKDSE